MSLNEYFDWKEIRISNWRKVLRIVYCHGFQDVDIRGISAVEGAKKVLDRHKAELKPDELEFIESILT